MKKLILIVLIAMLLSAITILWLRLNRTDSAVQELQRSALRQSAEELDTLTLHMEKALLTTDASRMAALLHRIGQSAACVQQSLAQLDASQDALFAAQVFVNDLAEGSAQRLPQLVGQQQFSEDDRAWLRQQLALCTQLAGQLALAENAEDLSVLHLDTVPSAEVQQPKGLPPGIVTQEEALSIARSFVGENRVRSVKSAPGTSGALAAFGATVETEDVQLNLEVTQQGGQILWMMPETASFTVAQDVSACLQTAADFLALHGFASMEMVYQQAYDGLCVISLVPTQDGVLLYPDLLRVQVRMDTAQVVGLEAHSYWLNHTVRNLPAPSLTKEQAAELLSPHVEVTSCCLCVIPYHSSELLCYECAVTWQGESYLVYLDAQTGIEVDSLKYIPVENGVLVA